MRRFVVSVLFALISLCALAQNAIKVRTDYDIVEVGEDFRVSFEMKSEDAPSSFEWHPGDAFKLLWGPQSQFSTQTSMINGNVSSSSTVTYSYYIQALKPGEYQLPQATAVLNGATQKSESCQIKVIDKSDDASEDDIFYRMEVNKATVVKGEPLTLTFKLYDKNMVLADFDLLSATWPSFKGFQYQAVRNNGLSYERELYNGILYNVLDIQQFNLVPQESGNLVIGPGRLPYQVTVKSNSASMNPIDIFYGSSVVERRVSESNSVTVKVLPLPAGAPVSFSGAVGKYSIDATLSRDKLKVGEASSLVITLSGYGDLTLMGSPNFQIPDGLELYDYSVKDQVSNDFNGIRQYEYPIIARKSGTYRIDPISYSYYDISKKAYTTIKTNPFTIVVEEDAEVEESVPNSRSTHKQEEVKSLDDDIRYINTKSGDIEAKGAFFISTPLFRYIVIFMFIAAAGIWYALTRYSRRNTDVAVSKSRKASKMAIKRLKASHEYLVAQNTAAFYDETHRALIGFISDKLNMTSGELSRDVISSLMSERCVSEKHCNMLEELLDICESARYSLEAGTDSMRECYDKALEWISTVDFRQRIKRSNGMKLPVIIALFTISFGASANDSQSVESLWNNANHAYAAGEWTSARETYQQILDMDMESASLYYNIGNAYYKEGNLAMAIVSYERALKLDPSYDDARYNLNLANNTTVDKLESYPEFFFTSWMRGISYSFDSDSWAIIFLVLLALTLTLVLFFLISVERKRKITSFFAALVLLVMTIAALSFSIWQKKDYQSSDKAIVLVETVMIKSAPSELSERNLFELHSGAKVIVLESTDQGWTKVSLPDGRQGWIQSDYIEVI